ncbi:hypothetical protein ACH5RR_000756 [Cinchona calisaya]|uniref:Pollen Ole e 1 allergen and extensin family protein n=1 Tax=Cinchona calisaya TaxID=153742 RepID=A0ABD3B1I4_9GENT
MMGMASHNQDHATFFQGLTLLLTMMTIVPYVVHGEIALRIGGFNARGQLACTNTGNVSPTGTSPPLVGANVIVSCNGTATTVTDANGLFDLTLNASSVNIDFTPTLSTGFKLPNCFAIVSLPVKGCSNLDHIGLLRAPLYSLGTSATPSQTIIILLRSAAGEFVLLPIR